MWLLPGIAKLNELIAQEIAMEEVIATAQKHAQSGPTIVEARVTADHMLKSPPEGEYGTLFGPTNVSKNRSGN